ncbi:MAG: hypothetical protein OEY61_09860, partial [Gammaproteobacteria bacterium]|nr:hypothetical protein [Gammaproteobacteria bacterium]
KILFLFLLLNTHIIQADNAFSVSGSLLYFDYEEFSDSGLSLNHETGFIPGINMNYRLENNQLAFTLHDGSVEYNGQTQSGSPHQTDTIETLYTLTYRHYFPVTDGLNRNNYYTGLGYQFWERDIQARNNINRLFEEYSWWTIEAGIQTLIYRQNNYQVTLDLGLLHTINGIIYIDLTDIGYGYPHLSLGNRAGINTHLTFTKLITDNQSLYINLNYKHWKFGKSNSQTLNNGTSGITITEPASHSNHSQLSLGWIIYF